MLPSGHPFYNVRASSYWSATASAQFAIGAWTVPFLFDMTVGVSAKSTPQLAWCMRGGQGVDTQ
jgi:hypothetical protein